MQAEKMERRRQEIRAAAYAVLKRKGYKAASMLAIAREARASNETLYAWYGNKEALFRSLIEENAAQVSYSLENALDTSADVETTLSRVGAVLLQLVTSDKAVALNRAAAADASETGELGRSLASAGRDSIAPLLGRLFDQARSRGALAFCPEDQIVDTFIGLLLRDTQIRRTTGVACAPTAKETRERAAMAASLLLRLFGNREVRQ